MRIKEEIHDHEKRITISGNMGLKDILKNQKQLQEILESNADTRINLEKTRKFDLPALQFLLHWDKKVRNFSKEFVIEKISRSVWNYFHQTGAIRLFQGRVNLSPKQEKEFLETLDRATKHESRF